ncbi:MAG: hypothetical protein WCH44_02815 [Betaproteobacteria bacterium]
MQLKPNSKAATYLRFLALKKIVLALPSSPVKDANESALLNVLCVNWLQGKPLAVRQAMELQQLGSPSTLHRRISRLKAMSLITDQSSPANIRIKLLVPTRKTLSYFDKLGTMLDRAREWPV